MTRAKGVKALRFGLRPKLILFSLALAFAPLVAIWPVGLLEDFLRREIAWEVERCVEDFIDEATRRGLDGERRVARFDGSTPSLSGAGPSSGASEGGVEAWVGPFARRRHVMIRLLDAEGRVRWRTSPRDAERWANVRDIWQGLDDIFYGPTGPPDLLAYEARLPEEGRREEVREALSGRAATRWRYDSDARMFVFSAAEPLPDGGVLYVTRISRRVIRSLYDMRYQLLKLTLFLAAAAFLFSVYVGRRMVSPLIKMERAIEAYLKHPRGRALERIALERNDELGDLSRSFRELASRLHRQAEQTAAVAGDLAHDLKNPIATVTTAAELLESREPLTAERQIRLASALTSAASHMQSSVEGLLALARLDASLTSTECGPVDLAALTARVVEEYRHAPRHEPIELVSTITAEDARLLGSEDQLEQLLRNLLDNALVFCEEVVDVQLERRSDALVLTVRDDGPGVSSGNREKIFQRFFSIRPEGGERGTGLGLSIVSAIASAHGGEVELLDDGATQELAGAAFRVTLPTGS